MVNEVALVSGIEVVVPEILIILTDVVPELVVPLILIVKVLLFG